MYKITPSHDFISVVFGRRLSLEVILKRWNESWLLRSLSPSLLLANYKRNILGKSWASRGHPKKWNKRPSNQENMLNPIIFRWDSKFGRTNFSSQCHGESTSVLRLHKLKIMKKIEKSSIIVKALNNPNNSLKIFRL